MNSPQTARCRSDGHEVARRRAKSASNPDRSHEINGHSSYPQSRTRRGGEVHPRWRSSPVLAESASLRCIATSSTAHKMKLVQRRALEEVSYRQSKHRGSPPTTHGGSAMSAMKFVDAGGQSRAIRTRTPSFETSETPGASTSAMATAAEQIRVGGNGVWRRFFRRAHNSTAVMVLREIGTGDLGGRIPGTSLYPGHAPTPTRSSWISGVLCAMRGVRSGRGRA